MKKTLLILVSFIVTNFIFSQAPFIKWGPEIPKPRKTDIAVLIGDDENFFYFIRSERSFAKIRLLTLEKYSKASLSVVYVRPFKIPEVDGKELKFEKSFLLNQQLMIFASRYDRDLDKHLLYLVHLNASDGSKADLPKEIDYIDADKKSNRGSFGFVLSNDSTKILIMHNEPYEKYDNQKFSYKLIDSDGKALWSETFEFPYRDKYFTLDNYRVDNNGKVYTLARITKEKSEREKGKPIYAYSLINYDHDTKKITETPISLDDKYISDINFTIRKHDKILLGGFYSNKTRNGLAGIFYMTIDKNSQTITTKNIQDFSDEFMSEFMSERRAKKDKELFDYKIDYLVSDSAGGFTIVAEQFYINIVTTCQPRGGCTTTTYYCYNDIIVVAFNADGTMKWARHIPKEQVSANDMGYYSSYSFNASKGSLYFLYNDDPKNYTKPKKYPRNGISRKMVTVLATLNADGKLDRQILFSAREERIYTRPKISKALSPGQTLFYAIKKKKFKFGIITYP